MPVPFNSKISFDYAIPENDGILEIFSVQGRFARRIKLTAQRGNIAWDSKKEKGGEVSSGICFAAVRTEVLRKTIHTALVHKERIGRIARRKMNKWVILLLTGAFLPMLFSEFGGG